jgi:aminoglycoside phosphotransferase (APT) family kinase protein
MAEHIAAKGVDTVRQLLATHLPDHRDSEIRVLGSGLDNTSYLVGGDVVIRLPRADDPGPDVDVAYETRVLTVVARHSPIAVPRPLVRLDTALIYRVLPGVPLIGVPGRRREQWAVDIGRALGHFLAALHAIDAAEIGAAVAVDDDPLQDWLDEAAESYEAAGHLVPANHRASIERFLGAPVPPGPDEMRFGHQDLGAEHVLVDPDTGDVTGVIDWSDAGFGDPAVDFGLMLRDLGPSGCRAALTGDRAAAVGRPRGDDALDVRVTFYARCRTLEDLRFGMEQDRPVYSANSLRAMGWLFAA